LSLLPVPRLSVDRLHAIIPKLPLDMQKDPAGRVIGVANSVIAHFLSRDWFAAHIRHDVRRPGFLNLDFSSDQKREASTFRVIELAENLFNLQHIVGFDACIDQMRGGGEKIESTCAELDFGRFLYIHEIDFRFVVPLNVKGADYDFEIILPDGLRVPADAKCKFTTTIINPANLANTLNKARGQLPADRAGMVFIKVPQRWIEEPANVEAMTAVVNKFLANTDRIISVKFYVSHLEIANGMVHHRHGIKELTNFASLFHEGRDWDLFTGHVVPTEWNGMPPKWQRLFFWPESRPANGAA